MWQTAPPGMLIPLRGHFPALAAQASLQHPDMTGIAHETAIPKNAPTPAVTAIATAPQKPTRRADFHTGAPIVWAATEPSSRRQISETPETMGVRPECGTSRGERTGRTAPNEDVPADANEAWSGRAIRALDSPSSLRA